MGDDRDTRNRGTHEQNMTTGAGAGSATSRAEDQGKKEERVDEGNEETETHDKARAAGFAPFRDWANRQLRRIPPGATLNYQGHDQKVTEITVDGQLRLEWQGAGTLIPFDERYIPDLLTQLLTAK